MDKVDQIWGHRYLLSSHADETRMKRERQPWSDISVLKVRRQLAELSQAGVEEVAACLSGPIADEDVSSQSDFDALAAAADSDVPAILVGLSNPKYQHLISFPTPDDIAAAAAVAVGRRSHDSGLYDAALGP